MRRCRSIFTALVVVGLALVGRSGIAAEPEALLPRPAALDPAVQFWTRVFSEVGTDAGFIHDARYLDVVYTVLRFPPDTSWHTQQTMIRAARERYRDLLQRAADSPAPADPEVQRLRALWAAHTSPDALANAAQRVRFQRGQADRFRAGLARSGAWRDYIRETLAAAGVPEALAALPHVESSFDPTAYSHADAAGLWQFTASTGRRFMQIDHVVDERLDPYLSTRAAAQLLRHNYQVTESWPLAITAYNHGAAGMRRAVERLGTRDIGVIAWRYDGRSFGFASRNFYAAFLAARDVEARAESLFGPVAVEPPRAERVVTPSDYLSVRTLANALGVQTPVLRALNPALLEPVWEGKKHWPRGFPLRVPAQTGPGDLDDALAAIPPSARYEQQVPDQYHQIGPGESLSVIAARYDTSVKALMRLNDLASPHRIRAGATLRLPGAGMPVPTARPVIAVLAPPGQPDASAVAAAAAPMDVAALTPLSAPEPSAPATERAAIPVPATPPIELASVAGTTDDDHVASGVEGMPRELGADPSDFDVAEDHTIEIQAFETLGHYAEWLDVRARNLRALNGLRYGTPLVVGRRLRLDFDRVAVADFEARRRDYHGRLQETFFANHRITGVVEHQVRAGDSLWLLAQRNANVPVWLLRQYNPGLNFDRLRPGTTVVVPVVETSTRPPSAGHADSDLAASEARLSRPTSRSASRVGSGSR